MPVIGDTVSSRKLGYKTRYIYIWLVCQDCGNEKWVRRSGATLRVRCRSCAAKHSGHQKGGKEHWNWKGGRIKTKDGYIYIKLSNDDFFCPMANHLRYVFEHRLVMAKALGRNLHSWELVHHKNHIRDDNRAENLQLISDDRHNQITILENRIKQLEARVILLEADNLLLQQMRSKVE